MATGFLLSDVGRTLSVKNDSTTSAIVAGDIVYASGGTTSVFPSTTTQARAGYAVSDTPIKAAKWGTTAQSKLAVGVAVTDIAADDTGTIALEGIFLNQVDATAAVITAGMPVKAAVATTNAVDLLSQDSGTTSTNLGVYNKLGIALSGANSTKDFLVWKLSK